MLFWNLRIFLVNIILLVPIFGNALGSISGFRTSSYSPFTTCKIRGGSTSNLRSSKVALMPETDPTIGIASPAKLIQNSSEDDSFIFDILNPTLHASSAAVGHARAASQSLLESYHQYIPFIKVNRHGHVSQVVKTKYDLLKEFSLHSWEELNFLDPLYSGSPVVRMDTRYGKSCFLGIHTIKLILDYQHQEVFIFPSDGHEGLMDQIVEVVRQAFGAIGNKRIRNNLWDKLSTQESPISSESVEIVSQRFGKSSDLLDPPSNKIRNYGTNLLKSLAGKLAVVKSSGMIIGRNNQLHVKFSSDNQDSSSVFYCEKCDSARNEMNSKILPGITEILQSMLFQHVVAIRSSAKKAFNPSQLKLSKLSRNQVSASNGTTNIGGLGMLQLKHWQRSLLVPLQSDLDLAKIRIDETKYFVEKALRLVEVPSHFDKNINQSAAVHIIPEWTSALDTILTELNWLLLEIRDLTRQASNQEEVVTVAIEKNEFASHKLGLFISITSLAIACGALVTGLFGMNLLSHFETSDGAFYMVSLFIVLCMNGVFKKMLNIAQQENVL